MANKHAVLSASSSERWLNCPPSARLCENYEDKGSDYASEGTDAHTLCEFRLKQALGVPTEDPTDNLSWYNEEMDECAAGYAAYVVELLETTKQTCTDPVVMIEQRVNFSRWVQDGFGTADCIVIADGVMNICDYKHGKGVEVSAVANPQMMLYALGALEIFDDIYDIDTVRMTIFQPRKSKSTFWNSVSRVLGLYSGNISADTLTFGCRRNVKPEMAEAKGKRLLIAAEMQEGARLNDSTVKQLCSVDDIFAEKKYKDPFSFSPSHSLVLYTNHLPRVSASDDGTWRRLIVIPFNAKIEGKSDIKNYGDYLYQNAAESILAWIIEGAKKVIDLGYKFPVPAIVQKAIDDYRSQNDWFGNFLAEKCEVGDGLKESSSTLYQAYRNYCLDCNEYVRNTADFYLALENAGFERLVLNRKRYFKGLKLKTDDGDFEDFLN